MRYVPDPEGSELDQWLAIVLDRLKAYVRWQVKEKCPNPDEVDVEVSFIRIGEFGAFADIQGGVDVIEVNLGTVFILRDLFDGLMAHPLHFPTIVGRETETLRGEAPIDVTSIDVDDALSGSPRPSRPRHANREWAAEAMFWGALYLLVAHELAHCLFGHTRWLRERAGISRVQDTPTTPMIAGDIIPALDRQTLEMDADAVSAHWIMLNWIATPECPGPKPDFSDATQREMYVLVHLLGIVGLFFLFKAEMRRERLTDEQLLALPHPPFLHRFINVVRVLQEQLVKNFVLEEDRVQAVVQFAVQGWDLTVTYIATGKVERELSSDEEVESVIEQLERLQTSFLDRWKTLRTELDPLKLSRDLPD